MARRYIRMTQEDLNRSALAQATQFQKAALMKMMLARWRVSSINPSPHCAGVMITIRHEADSKAGAAIYCNGSVSRQNGTIKWDWKRLADSYLATIPDPFVAETLAKEA